jgi:hypothetical protein
MFSAAPVHFPPSPAGFSTTATTHAGAHHAGIFRDLARSAEILSQLADSRPGGYIQSGELLDMAANRHDQFRRDQQTAARIFLFNPRAVNRAREHARRPGANAHSCSGAGRAYDYYDLQSMCRYMLNDTGGSASDGMGHDPQAHWQAPYAYRLSLRGAIHDLIGHLLGRGRYHMSLERLMAMQHHGHGGAGLLLGNIAMLDAMIDRMVFRNLAISLENLRNVGTWMDAQPADHFYFDPAAMAATVHPAGPGFAGQPAAATPYQAPVLPATPLPDPQNGTVPNAQYAQSTQQNDYRRQQDRQHDDNRRQQDRLGAVRQQQERENAARQQQQHKVDDFQVQERIRITREHLQRDVTLDHQNDYRHQLDHTQERRRQENLNIDRLNADRLETDRLEDIRRHDGR